MAVFDDHIALSRTLFSDFETSLAAGEWPIAVDAGYYAVFHGMEAMSALENWLNGNRSKRKRSSRSGASTSR